MQETYSAVPETSVRTKWKYVGGGALSNKPTPFGKQKSGNCAGTGISDKPGDFGN